MSINDSAATQAGQKQIEEVIKRIKGVVACNVVYSAEGDLIEEIHVLSESSRLPKQLVRDIESAVMASLNIPLDHKKISVAQTKGVLPPEKYSRVVIGEVDVLGNKNWLCAKVSVKLGEALFTGEAEGPNSEANRYRILASAACKAVETVIDQRARFVIEEVSWNQLPSCKVVSVVLAAVNDNKVEKLVGSCLCNADSDFTIVKAVLDALNRRIDVMA